ncbi:MAG TPA: hypothetical protein VG326_17050 [Tepidisphaeraceae bacterium]|nr:hypothetical protein [Tepidisphaeraceae bacterium]
MKAVMGLAAGLSLLLGGVAFMGCTSDQSTLPRSEQGAYAGGNGEFGENPEQPGTYHHAPAPATQPSDLGAGQSTR